LGPRDGGAAAAPCWLLTSLELSDNLLTGALPDAMLSPGAFCNLIQLKLAGNRFQGPLPAAWLFGHLVDPAAARWVRVRHVD
jgi:hypothetical protein